MTLMDIEMQQMDGLAATREIIAADPEAKIVIVSRHGDELFRVAAKEAGVCDYVLKENLLDLRQLLGGRWLQPVIRIGHRTACLTQSDQKGERFARPPF